MSDYFIRGLASLAQGARHYAVPISQTRARLRHQLVVMVLALANMAMPQASELDLVALRGKVVYLDF